MHFTNVNKRLSEDNLLSKIISINLFNWYNCDLFNKKKHTLMIIMFMIIMNEPIIYFSNILSLPVYW